MKRHRLFKIWVMFLSLIFLSGCDFLFENFKDVQARKALRDLMAIQDDFYRENNRYAQSLVEISKYNLNYHSGIVYLEIEKASKEGYRAVALPAESSTARVFAYDSAKGGFYEMDEEEVSVYVLGALNYIRSQQAEKNYVDYMSILIIVALIWFGFVFYRRNRVAGAGWVFIPYYLNLAPLGLAVTILNHMHQEIVFSNLLQGSIIAAGMVSLISLVIHLMSFSKIPSGENKANLNTFVFCGISIALCSATILTYTFATYYGTVAKSPVFFIPGQ